MSSRVRCRLLWTLCAISLGRFSRTQARISSRNFCSSGVKAKSMGDVSGVRCSRSSSTPVLLGLSKARQTELCLQGLQLGAQLGDLVFQLGDALVQAVIVGRGGAGRGRGRG